MSDSHLFMVRVSADAQRFEATARCVEREPILHFTDPLQLLAFLRHPDRTAPAEARPHASSTNPVQGDLR